MRKKWTGKAVLGAALMMMLWRPVLAAEEIRVAGAYTGEDEISLYVKGLDIASAEEIADAACQIGTKTGQQVSYEDASDAPNMPRTLIMVDNSLSITEGNREKISSFLTEFVYSTGGKEEISLAVFDEELRTVVDYTSDNKTLRDAVKELTYQDQETYLTDVLYDVIARENLGAQDCYKRIIIVSDGVDNKAIGYTKEELYALIREKGYPIYTLGCVYKSNNEQLENMFALSRLTGAKDFLLDEEEDMDVIVDAIEADSHVVHFRIQPDSEVMDGSSKNVLLTVQTPGGEQTIETDARMPLQAEVPEPEPVPVPVPEPEPPEVQPEEEGISPVIFIAVGLAAIVVVVIVVIILRRKSANGRDQFTVFEDPGMDVPVRDTERTVLVSDQSGEDATQMIWSGAAKQYTLHLTDVKNPARTFQTPLKGGVVIGRRAGEVNIVIDYEKTISGKHCQIAERGGKFYVKDLQSSNGTMLNGVRILSEMEVHSGSILTLGRLEMKVEIR